MTKFFERTPRRAVIRALNALLIFAVLPSSTAISVAVTAGNQAPADRTAAWADIAKLPDWDGIWLPHIGDQRDQEKGNVAPWSEASAEIINNMMKAEDEGRPAGIFNDCMPEGMPTWMMISHNAMEFQYSPGRITLLGESDGNRLRRIYTDGRAHPQDPDLTYHGHSIAHWEKETLVVDTIGVDPDAYIAITEAVGVRNGGGMHIVERIYLVDEDTLHDEITIIAPTVMTKPWKTTRIFKRLRGAQYDIVEGVCLMGMDIDQVDEDGNAVFDPSIFE
ncbi:MAG: hypothetical protein OSA77_00850 [Halioglobus sp.]|nr:hypothetical protein [Halioglobus sp.]